MECYDPHLTGPMDVTPLQEGMVLATETPYYKLGFGNLQIEDMIVVTKDGFRYLTLFSKDLRILP
jgi:Xaa-Pro aminopeptidase